MKRIRFEIIALVSILMLLCGGCASQTMDEKLNRLTITPKLETSISKIIDSLGAPDYQTGWMEYIDMTGVSPCYSNLKDFEGHNIPIKVYVWKMTDSYLVCFCTYTDYRFRYMPGYLVYDENNDTFPLSEWLSACSGDDGLFLFRKDEVESLENINFCYYQDVSLYDYSHKEKLSLYEFVESNLFIPFGENISLKDINGQKRGNIISLFGEPDSSTVCHTETMPLTLYEDCWLGFQRFSSFIRIDRYNYNKCHHGGTVCIVYNHCLFSDVVSFAYIKTDSDFVVEY